MTCSWSAAAVRFTWKESMVTEGVFDPMNFMTIPNSNLPLNSQGLVLLLESVLGDGNGCGVAMYLSSIADLTMPNSGSDMTNSWATVKAGSDDTFSFPQQQVSGLCMRRCLDGAMPRGLEAMLGVTYMLTCRCIACN